LPGAAPQTPAPPKSLPPAPTLTGAAAASGRINQASPSPAEVPSAPAAAPPKPAAATPARVAAGPPASAAVHPANGRKLIQEEKLKEAVAELDLAVQLDPKLALAWNARGFAFLRLREYANAIASFNEAIRLNPSYANAYTNRAAAKRASGDVKGAEADQQKARELLPAVR